MIPTVRLSIENGKLAGKAFSFDVPQACAVGREADCTIRLPSAGEFLHVSRHHCMLYLDPPDVRVRDLGSRNGTYANGIQLESGRGAFGDPLPLFDGDVLRVGRTVFRVEVTIPETCDHCGADLDPIDVLLREDSADPHLCTDCRDKRQLVEAETPACSA